MKCEVELVFPPTVSIEVVEALWDQNVRVSHYAVTVFWESLFIDSLFNTNLLLSMVDDALAEAGLPFPDEFVVNVRVIDEN